MLWQAYACGCDLSRKEASIWLSSPVKYALEKQNTKKVSQGKLSCYKSKFHGVKIGNLRCELRGAGFGLRACPDQHINN